MIKTSHLETPHSGRITLDEAGRMISPTQRSLPNITQHSQKTDIHVSGEIRTRNSSKRPTSDPRLIPCGHRDRQQYAVTNILSNINAQTCILRDPHFTCWSSCNISSHTPLSLRSLDQMHFCCKFLVTFFQLLTPCVSHGLPIRNLYAIFRVCLKCLGKFHDRVPQTKRMKSSSYR